MTFRLLSNLNTFNQLFRLLQDAPKNLKRRHFFRFVKNVLRKKAISDNLVVGRYQLYLWDYYLVLNDRESERQSLPPIF